jgi:Zn finger protein HypA/HybF involved in hydrogenase expression
MFQRNPISEKKSENFIIVNVNFDSLTCPITLDFLLDPALTSCGHAMESSEFKKTHKPKSQPCCPLCRSENVTWTTGENMGVIFNDVLNTFYMLLPYLPKDVTEKSLNLSQAFIKKLPQSGTLSHRLANLISFKPTLLKDTTARLEILTKRTKNGVDRTKVLSDNKSMPVKINIDSFICPVTNSFMIDPVLTSCGHTFESSECKNGANNTTCAVCQTQNITLSRGTEIGTVFNEVLNAFYQKLGTLSNNEEDNKIFLQYANLAGFTALSTSDQINDRLINLLCFNTNLIEQVAYDLAMKRFDIYKKLFHKLIINEKWDILELLSQKKFFNQEILNENAYLLARSEKGRLVLAHSISHGIMISQEVLNQIQTEGDQAGCSVAYWLATDIIGQKILICLMKKNIIVNNQALNWIIQNTPLEGSSMVLKLAKTDFGRGILSLLMQEKLIPTEDTLNSIVKGGEDKDLSPASVLASSLEEATCPTNGIILLGLLMTNNIFIRQDILNHRIVAGPLAGHSLASLLAKHKLGLEIIDFLATQRNVLIDENTLNEEVPKTELEPDDFTLAVHLHDSELGKKILRDLNKKGIHITDINTRILLGGFINYDLSETKAECTAVQMEVSVAKAEPKAPQNSNKILSLTFPAKRKQMEDVKNQSSDSLENAKKRARTNPPTTLQTNPHTDLFDPCVITAYLKML